VTVETTNASAIYSGYVERPKCSVKHNVREYLQDPQATEQLQIDCILRRQEHDKPQRAF
jgi:hypothetical protein